MTTTIADLEAVLPDAPSSLADELADRVADAEDVVLRRALATGRARAACNGCMAGVELTNRINALVTARREEDLAVDEWISAMHQHAAAVEAEGGN